MHLLIANKVLLVTIVSFFGKDVRSKSHTPFPFLLGAIAAQFSIQADFIAALLLLQKAMDHYVLSVHILSIIGLHMSSSLADEPIARVEVLVSLKSAISQRVRNPVSTL